MTRKEFEDRIFGDNEFVGTEQNKANAERFTMMANVAKAIGKKRNDFSGVLIDDVNDATHRNCSIHLDLKKVGMSTNASVINGLKLLLENCDDVSYSILGGNLRISFGVYDIWSDGKPFERGDLFSEITEEEEEEIDRLVDEHFNSLTLEQLEEISRA